jgi:hypothetical protein
MAMKRVPCVLIDERTIVQVLLPNGFAVLSEVDGGFFIHDNHTNTVGFVSLDDEGLFFVFEHNEHGMAFREAILQKYPNCV